MTTKGNTPRPFSKRQTKTTQSTKTTEDNMAKKDTKKTEQENESKFYFLTSEHISTNWTNQHHFRIITKIPRFVNIKCHIVAIIVT